MSRHLCTLTVAAATAAAAFALAAPAASAASPLDGVGTTSYAVAKTGTCSGHSWYDLAATPDGEGRIKVKAGVDSNRAGQSWSWQLLDNGEHFAGGIAETVAPRGSFTVQRRTADQVGVDRIRLRATNPRTGETCSGSVLLPV